ERPVRESRSPRQRACGCADPRLPRALRRARRDRALLADGARQRARAGGLRSRRRQAGSLARLLSAGRSMNEPDRQLTDIHDRLVDLRTWVQHVHGVLLFSQQTDVAREIARLLSDPALDDPKRLERHGYKAYSQGDEDGMIAAILSRIGPGERRFVEIGS